MPLTPYLMISNSLFHKKDLLIMFKQMSVSLLCPINLSYWWNIGSLLLFLMILQVTSGFLLTFYYTPNFYTNLENHLESFMSESVQIIHANYPSVIFFFIYIHLIKGLKANSFANLKLVWVSGCTLLVLLMGVSFLGYVLPWGQMSLWGATVIINLLTVLPYGNDIVLWVWGGYFVSQFTIQMFFSFHFIIPFMIMCLSGLHLYFLHFKGSSNFLSVDSGISKTEFLPNFFYKDLINTPLILVILSFIMWDSFMLLDPENFIKANLSISPIHIKPEWYFLHFYAILRAVPNKLGGVVLFILAFVTLVFLMSFNSYMNYSSFKIWELVIWVFIVINLMLIWLGGSPVETPYLLLSQYFTIFYYLWFMLIFLMSVY